MILQYILISLLTLLTPQNNQIELTISNIDHAKGTIVYSVYTPTNKFLDDKDVTKWGKIKVTSTKDLTTIIDIPANASDIAIAIYHDVNDNGKMDKSFVGIPQEPYGFSRNYVPSFRAPKWSESNFNPKTTKSLTIKLIQ